MLPREAWGLSHHHDTLLTFFLHWHISNSFTGWSGKENNLLLSIKKKKRNRNKGIEIVNTCNFLLSVSLPGILHVPQLSVAVPRR